MPDQTVVLDRDDMQRTLVRIAHEIVEKNPPAKAATVGARLAIVGVHRRGAVLAQRLQRLTRELSGCEVPLGSVDISFYRDDLGSRTAALRTKTPVVHATQLEFPVDGRTIVIVDDVLYTGRTARAAIDVIFDYGRPARIQLAALIDRGHRELPIRPDYVGKNLPTAQAQHVSVRVHELDGVDQVLIGPAVTGGPTASAPGPTASAPGPTASAPGPSASAPGPTASARGQSASPAKPTDRPTAAADPRDDQ